MKKVYPQKYECTVNSSKFVFLFLFGTTTPNVFFFPSLVSMVKCRGGTAENFPFHRGQEEYEAGASGGQG